MLLRRHCRWRVQSTSAMESDMDIDQASMEEQIRTRAYYLWEHATEPKGTPDEYWEQARAEIEKETPISEVAAQTAASPDPSSKV
jgi:hypothetical protein